MKSTQPNSNSYSLGRDDFIVSKTDLQGKITYCNQIFMRLAKYSEKELIGMPHSIIRHPDMPRAVFKLLWSRIKKGEEIFAFVKNLSKDGGYYWVFANVTASVDTNGKIIGYYSVRRKPNDKAIKVIDEVYKSMVNLERNSSMEASSEYLNDLLKEKDLSYDELIFSLQE